jgi:preprotein translocase subunit SecE
MAKIIVDKSGDKSQGKAPGGFKNPFSRSSSKAAARSAASQAPRGAISAKPEGRIRTFFREVRVEMTKVTWPPRKELITSTGAVIVAVIVTGIYIGVFDFIWNLLIREVKLG